MEEARKREPDGRLEEEIKEFRKLMDGGDYIRARDVFRRLSEEAKQYIKEKYPHEEVALQVRC